MKISRKQDNTRSFITPIHDKFYFYSSIPAKYQDQIEKNFGDGIDVARSALDVRMPVRSYFYLWRSRSRLTCGCLWRKGQINMGVSSRVLKSPIYLKRLRGNAIHEYVHLLRNPESSTVLAAAIEEGIAAYLETKLFLAPNYLDIKTLNNEMVKTCADKLEAALLEKPSNWPIIWQKEIPRTMLYRLGFGLVRAYALSHPRASLSALLNLPQDKFISFSKNYLKL